MKRFIFIFALVNSICFFASAKGDPAQSLLPSPALDTLRHLVSIGHRLGTPVETGTLQAYFHKYRDTGVTTLADLLSAYQNRGLIDLFQPALDGLIKGTDWPKSERIKALNTYLAMSLNKGAPSRETLQRHIDVLFSTSEKSADSDILADALIAYYILGVIDTHTFCDRLSALKRAYAMLTLSDEVLNAVTQSHLPGYDRSLADLLNSLRRTSHGSLAKLSNAAPDPLVSLAQRFIDFDRKDLGQTRNVWDEVTGVPSAKMAHFLGEVKKALRLNPLRVNAGGVAEDFKKLISGSLDGDVEIAQQSLLLLGQAASTGAPELQAHELIEKLLGLFADQRRIGEEVDVPGQDYGWRYSPIADALGTALRPYMGGPNRVQDAVIHMLENPDATDGQSEIALVAADASEGADVAAALDSFAARIISKTNKRWEFRDNDLLIRVIGKPRLASQPNFKAHLSDLAGLTRKINLNPYTRVRALHALGEEAGLLVYANGRRPVQWVDGSYDSTGSGRDALSRLYLNQLELSDPAKRFSYVAGREFDVEGSRSGFRNGHFVRSIDAAGAELLPILRLTLARGFLDQGTSTFFHAHHGENEISLGSTVQKLGGDDLDAPFGAADRFSEYAKLNAQAFREHGDSASWTIPCEDELTTVGWEN